MANIIKIGLGNYVTNHGTYDGFPALFIEPVVGDGGTTGAKLKHGEQPHIKLDAISDAGTVIIFAGVEGAKVVLDDMQSAIANIK